MTANPFRIDPERCAIGQQSAVARRKRRQLAFQRACRPDDAAERAALQAACARYAELHGAYETMGLLSLELARYAPDLPEPRRQAKTEAERLFQRDGEDSKPSRTRLAPIPHSAQEIHMPVALKAPLTKSEQRVLRNQFKHQEVQAARAARGQSTAVVSNELAALSAAERRKVVHSKSGLEWLRDKQRLDPHQFRAGRAYGMLYRVAILPNGVRLRSCLDDTPRSGVIGVPTSTTAHLVAAEWLADSRVRLDAARVSLGSHPGMILACDLICGQGLTPRDVNQVQREAEKLETTLRIALDLAHAHFASAGWPGQSE